MKVLRFEFAETSNSVLDRSWIEHLGFGVLLVSVFGFSSFAQAASCNDTYVGNAKIFRLIDEEAGEGASRHCRITPAPGGVTSDYMLAADSCYFPGRGQVRFIVYSDENMLGTKCRVYVSAD